MCEQKWNQIIVLCWESVQIESQTLIFLTVFVDKTMNCEFDENEQGMSENCSVQFSVTVTNLSDGISTTNADENISDYEDYYDSNDSVNSLDLGELIPVVLVYSITLVLGVLGNALVIFSIIRYRRMQNVTNIFLTSLASADLLLVILCVPVKVSWPNLLRLWSSFALEILL